MLFQHDCVVLPNFGGFIANFHSAEFEHGSYLIHPSSKKISFNNQLTQSDGILAQHIARVHAMSYHESIEIIENYVRELKNHLIRGEEYSFPDVGTIVLKDGNRYVFTPFETNFNNDSFGLKPVKAIYAEINNHQRKITHVEKEITIIQPELKSNWYKKWTLYGGIAACLLVLLLVGQYSYYKLKNKNNIQEANVVSDTMLFQQKIDKEESENSSVRTANIAPTSIIDSVNAITTENTEEKKVSNTEVEKTKETKHLLNVKLVNDNSVQNKNSGNQTLIVFGVFSNMNNAEKLVAELAKKNITAQVIKPLNSKNFKTAMLVQGSKSNGFAQLKQLKANNPSIDAFVTVERL